MRTTRLLSLLHLHFLPLLLYLGAAEGRGQHYSQQRGRPKLTPNIIGGTDAKIGEFPHQVSVQHRGFFTTIHVCGGTIVNEFFILTAATCIAEFTVKSIHVVAGVTSLEEDGAQVMQVGSAITHSNFNSETHSNNIALLKLSEPLVFGEFVQAIDLPPDGETVLGNTPCTAIGWGATTASGDIYKKLQKAKLTAVTDAECRGSYGAMAIEDSMMCAGLPVEDSDTCDGDEGGPLLCMGNLHGITSWGMGCSLPYYPRVFTEVAYYREWILMYISG